MNFKYTKHQVARGSRPDGERNNALLLVKHVSSLRLTYQIRLLTLRAIQLRKKLFIEVPKHCTIHAALEDFQAEHVATVRIERY